MSFVQQQPGGRTMMDDWLKAWKSWASTRKRGKMAQFIIQKLETNKQARWLDIRIGKFELTEWHKIAEEWFKEKPRNSDQVDAPCMLRKGLPRAFPGLDEVKSESVKEGTQYRSRVFQAPPNLVQEVQLYVNKGSTSATIFTSLHNDMSSYAPMVPTQQPQLYYTSQTNGGAGYIPNNYVSPVHQQPPIKLEAEPYIDVGGSPSSSDQASPYTAYSYDGNHGYENMVMLDGGSSGFQMEQSGNDLMSNGHSSPYNSPFGLDGASPITSGAQQVFNPAQTLQVPPAAVDVSNDTWSNGGSAHNSPRYSPDPNYQQQPVDMTTSQQPISPPINPATLIGQPSPMSQVGLEVKPYPDKSPLEGGGKLALLFGRQLPQGPYWLSFISQQRPEYVHQIEALQENAMALTAIIPKHDIPETMSLQVMCGNNQVIAQTEFMYFADAQYHSDLLFQYLTQSFPTYFPDVGGMGPGGGPIGQMGAGGGGVFGGYYGNVPSTSYSLLLGSCRLGIEPLVFATLQLPKMQAITIEQLQKAHDLAEDNGHTNLSGVFKMLIDIAQVVSSKGDGESSEVKVLEQCHGSLDKLDSGGTPRDGALKVLSRLSQIHRMEKRQQLEEEREQQVPGSPTIQPASPTPQPPDQSEEPTGRRRLSSNNKLQRQEKSVIEEDDPPTEDLIPPPEVHSRRSIAEQDDHLPPLRPSKTSGAAAARRAAIGMRKMLITSYSDAADSAVSMSFDREDFELEMARRNSASLASSGLYSLNSSCSSDGALSINIDAEAGYSFAHSLHYECVYQVTEDYPPNSDYTNVIFKAGDKIIQIGDTPVRDKSGDEFAELLQREAPLGTTIKIVPRVSPPPSSHSIASSLGYCSLDAGERRSLVRRQSDREMVDSITMKVSNLLSMKSSSAKRSVTLPVLPGGEGFGFKVMGGSAVGLFVSEVKAGRKELQVGDQLLEIAGETTLGMSYFEATQILHAAKDKVQLKVTENSAKFQAIRDQFEHESFYMRCHVDNSPTDVKDMSMSNGALVRVVNCTLYPNHWLAWKLDPTTGNDQELRRIPSPGRARQQFGKEIYETIENPKDVLVA